MTDPTEDERILGDLPELPEHVWTGALGHAFDPQAEPDVDLVPTHDLTEPDPGDDLTVTALGDLSGDAAHDPFDHVYGGGSSEYDHGYHDHDYGDPGLSDTDGYF